VKGVLAGFAIIGIIIGLGFLLAQLKILDATAQGVRLAGDDLLAVTVIPALPTAQNVFTFAMHYGRGVILARDMIFVATLLSVPVILAITWILAS
jgi:predicted permease